MAHYLPISELTPESFAPYGEIIQAPPESGSSAQATGANQGTAQKFHYVAPVVNLRSYGNAKPNLCIFQCKPRNGDGTLASRFVVKLLERHPFSTQFFLPFGNDESQFPLRYIVIVAQNNKATDQPDLSTLKAFEFHASQGVNYREGCWHHPMIALDQVTTFAVLVHEDGSAGDCEGLNDCC